MAHRRVSYSSSILWRLIFFVIGIVSIFTGFAVDGVSVLGCVANGAEFKLARDSYCDMRFKENQQYKWNVKYSFSVGNSNYSGYKILRGSKTEVHYMREVCYLPMWPEINWLRAENSLGVCSVSGVIIGIFFLWLSVKKRLLYDDVGRYAEGNFIDNRRIISYAGLGPADYLKVCMKECTIGFKNMPLLKVIIFTIILASVWIFLIKAKLVQPENSYIAVASMLTYSQSGLYGDIIDFFGGILGRVFFALFFMQLVIECNADTRYLRGYKESEPSSYLGFVVAGSWLTGFGISLFLFDFMTGGLRREDSIIGLIMFFWCWKARNDLNSRLMGFINSFFKGKPKYANVARKAVGGAAIGFLVSFILIWTPFCFIASSSMLGIMLCLLGSAIFASGCLLDRRKSETENI